METAGRQSFLARGLLGTAAVTAAAGWVALSATDPDGLVHGFVDTALRVAFWGAILASCARVAAWGVGSRLTGLSHLVWDGAAGLATLIGMVLVIGLLPGGFRPLTMAPLLGAVVVAGVLTFVRDPVRRFRGTGPLDVETAAGVLLLAVVVTAGLAWNRVPPLFFDSLAYHFAQPELWLVQGRIAPEAWSLHSWFPLGMSVLYGMGLAAGGTAWAADANLLVGALLLALALDLGRRSFGRGTGIVAALVLLSLPLTLFALAIPAADLGHGLFAAASLGALLLGRGTGHPCWTRRAGLLAAGAVLTKYLGLVVPLAAGASWILARPGRVRRSGVLRFLVPSVVLLTPWLAANLATVGNPVAPVLSEVVATRGLAPGGAERFQEDARGGFPATSDLRQLGVRWVTGDPGESRIYPTPALGWGMIALLPFGLIAARGDRDVRGMLALVAGLLVVWLLTFRWERFLVAASTFLAVVLAAGVARAWARRGVARAGVLVALLVALAVPVISVSEIQRFTGGGSVAVGRERPEALLERSFPAARLYRRANEILDPATARVLLLGETRHFGLKVLRAAPTGFNTHPLVETYLDDDDVDSINRELRRQGYSHIIVDPGWVERSGASYPSLERIAGSPEFLQGYVPSLGAPLAVESGAGLFEIPDEGARGPS